MRVLRQELNRTRQTWDEFRKSVMHLRIFRQHLLAIAAVEAAGDVGLAGFTGEARCWAWR